MATKLKDSTTPGRERKSGSTSPASLTKRSTKPTTPDKPFSTSNSSSTAKPLPNYLRSTASSSRQLPSLTKSRSLKKTHDSHNQESKSPKPSLNRRRSFDKPPSPSGLHRSPGREFRETPQRSKSLSVKSVSNVPKPTSKPVSGSKPQALHAKTSGTSLRRSISGIASGSSKKDSRSDGSTTNNARAPRSQDITEILNLEANLDALNRHEVGEADKIDSIEEDNSQDLPDPKLAEEEQVDQQQHHTSDTGHDTSSVKNAAEESKADVDTKNEEVIQAEKNLDGYHDHVEEIKHISKDQEGNDNIDQGSNSTSEETKVEEAIKEKKEDESKNEEDTEAVDGGSHEVDPKEGQDGDIKEEAKPEEAKATKKPQEAAAAATPTAGNYKKESSPAYNDVIEETATKLMSQDQKRRNKVKALVGAFETVIDYESGSKP